MAKIQHGSCVSLNILSNDWDEIESEEDEAFLLLEREITEDEGYESNSDSDGDGDVDGGD